MGIRSLSTLTVLGGVLLLPVAGCLWSAAPENEVTWAVKAATGNLTAATETEWQAVAEQVDEVVPEVDVALTDAQAEAIVEFVRLNGIRTVQDIWDIIAQALADPGSIVLPDGFLELFSSFTEEDFAAFLGLLEG
jgi:hypothetical protein